MGAHQGAIVVDRAFDLPIQLQPFGLLADRPCFDDQLVRRFVPVAGAKHGRGRGAAGFGAV